MKTPLGTEVDIGAGHIVLDGFPALTLTPAFCGRELRVISFNTLSASRPITAHTCCPIHMRTDRIHVRTRVEIAPMGGAILVDRGTHCKVWALSAVNSAKAAEPIDLPFGSWTLVG